MTEQATGRPLGAQLSHMLRARGVEVIFGIPGVHNQEMYRGIEEAGITHVLTRHEQGAGFMADGYARATGRPGVCYIITGPGLCNIMTPLGQAYSDSVSLLAISSCLPQGGTDDGRLHEMLDQRGAGAAVCDWSHEATSPEDAYVRIDQALAEFQDRRPRPKHLQVPIPMLEAAAPEFPAEPAQKPKPRLAPSAGQIKEAAALLAGARRPLVVVGGGARGASAEARTLVSTLRAASLASYAGRGVIDPGDPLHLGSVLARPDSAALIASSDCVLIVGSVLAEVDIWRDIPGFGEGAKVIRIDIDPTVLARDSRVDLAIRADAKLALAALIDALKGKELNSSWAASEAQEARRRWRAQVEAERPGILPVADAMREVLPEDALIYSDMTQFAYAAKEVYPLMHPGLWHHPYGFGTLGYALPAAIGGKIGVGSRVVIAIAGDYGFQYTIQELGVAVELGLTLPILLWDNGKLGEIEASMVRAQIAPNAVIQRNPDFIKLAEAYGACSAQPSNLAEFKRDLAAALKADGPTILRVTSEISLG
jgi:5-guanidino-2-oxopentanoate decarboxylase